MEQYDVVIVGAGPAGLFMAKELSKDFSVCVIEKNKIGETSKFWVVSNKNIKDNKLEDCVISKPHRCCYKDYTGKSIGGIIKDGNPIVDEHKVLKKWAEEAKRNRAVLRESTNFKKFIYKENNV